MNYARVAGSEGTPFHIEWNGRALCGGFTLGPLVSERPDEVCNNCDNRLRERGRRTKTKKPAKRAPRQIVYVPRNRFTE